jgi:hypothetical protein
LQTGKVAAVTLAKMPAVAVVIPAVAVVVVVVVVMLFP